MAAHLSWPGHVRYDNKDPYERAYRNVSAIKYDIWALDELTDEQFKRRYPHGNRARHRGHYEKELRLWERRLAEASVVEDQQDAFEEQMENQARAEVDLEEEMNEVGARVDQQLIVDKANELQRVREAKAKYFGIDIDRISATVPAITTQYLDCAPQQIYKTYTLRVMRSYQPTQSTDVQDWAMWAYGMFGNVNGSSGGASINCRINMTYTDL